MDLNKLQTHERVKGRKYFFYIGKLASLKGTLVWNYDLSTYQLTGLDKRATCVAKKLWIYDQV